MADTTWNVLPHRAIEKLETNLWRVEGDLPGMPIKRVMTVAKRSDGRLVIHNAMALEEAAMREVEAFGEPAFLVVPNGWHRMDAPAFKARYPKITVLCPTGSKKKVEQVVAVDGDYDAYPQDDDVRLEPLGGVGDAEGIMTVKSSSGTTLVLNDAIFNMPHVPGFQGFVFKHLTASSGGPKVSRIAKYFMVKDKAAFRSELERLAGTPGLVRAIVSHHETITGDVAATLRGVAASL
ncbi:MAG: hypothetical protein HOV80_15425 [Polyangiaceae bacterium]|nr:hypothetical protein [Polyangiaceae bacterium]